MPSKSLREELLDSSMDEYDLLEPDPIGHPVTSDSPKTQSTRKSSLKPTYENPGLDTTQMYVPVVPPKHEGNLKLVLENEPIPLDDTIPTYERTGKKAYKEVHYNKEYKPPDFTSPRTKHV